MPLVGLNLSPVSIIDDIRRDAALADDADEATIVTARFGAGLGADLPHSRRCF